MFLLALVSFLYATYVRRQSKGGKNFFKRLDDHKQFLAYSDHKNTINNVMDLETKPK